jgi:hypothetical protein
MNLTAEARALLHLAGDPPCTWTSLGHPGAGRRADHHPVHGHPLPGARLPAPAPRQPGVPDPHRGVIVVEDSDGDEDVSLYLGWPTDPQRHRTSTRRRPCRTSSC